MFTMPAFQKKAVGGVDEEEVCDFLMSIDQEYEAELNRLKDQLNDLLRAGAEMKQSLQKERQLVLSLREQTAVLTKENEALRARVEELEAGRAASEEEALSAAAQSASDQTDRTEPPSDNSEAMLRLLCEQVAQNRRAIEALEKRLEPAKKPTPVRNVGFAVPEEPGPADFQAYFK